MRKTHIWNTSNNTNNFYTIYSDSEVKVYLLSIIDIDVSWLFLDICSNLVFFHCVSKVPVVEMTGTDLFLLLADNDDLG